MSTSSILRPITQKLTSVPVEELSYIANFLASSLSNCSETLSATHVSNATSRNNEDAILVHKLKTRISSLLQDRKPQGRWTAIVLIKAVVEAGGWEILKGCEAWTRGLVAILGKSDPYSTKKLAIICISRIFILTQPYQTLLREITTPNLPTFITSCLNLVTKKDQQSAKRNASLLRTVLESFNILLPHHPATFRPFAPRIHSLLLKVLYDCSTPTEVKSVARVLFAALHYCAAKNMATSEWDNAFRTLISSIHLTSDQVFRAIIEDWESCDEQRRQVSVKHNYEQVVASSEEDPLGLPMWQGIPEGMDRILDLLEMLSSFLTYSSSVAVSIPVGVLLDMTARMASVLVPRPGKGSPTGSRSNPEVAREERDEFFLHVPTMHIATIRLFSRFINAVRGAGMSVLPIILDQVSWIFEAESDRTELRFTTYALLQRMLPLLGSSLTKNNMKILIPVLRACAYDVSAKDPSSSFDACNNKPRNAGTAAGGNADSFLAVPKSSLLNPSNSISPPRIAWTLLSDVLQFIPGHLIPHSLRTELDKTAIVVGHKEALFASILNPPPATRGKPPPPSLLPWLAQYHDNDLAFEGLLRPRMPIVSTSTRSTEHLNGGGDEEEEDIAFPVKANTQRAPWDSEDPPTSFNGVGSSLLDQLEEQLPADSPSVRIEDETLGISGVPPSDPELETVSSNTQKRDYSQLEPPANLPLGSTSAPIGSSTSNPVQPSNKRFKPDQLPTTSPSIPLTQPTSFNSPLSASSITREFPTKVQSPNIIAENVAPTASTILPSTSQDHAIISKTIEPDEDGDDSSDFEMPEINLEPDTDDELEEDDDSREGDTEDQ